MPLRRGISLTMPKFSPSRRLPESTRHGLAAVFLGVQFEGVGLKAKMWVAKQGSV